MSYLSLRSVGGVLPIAVNCWTLSTYVECVLVLRIPHNRWFLHAFGISRVAVTGLCAPDLTIVRLKPTTSWHKLNVHRLVLFGSFYHPLLSALFSYASPKTRNRP